MKVYDRNLTGPSAPETGRAQEAQNLNRAGSGKSPTRDADGSNDRVEFSSTLSWLWNALATFESARASRIQALAVEYQSGKFEPDSAATSKALVA